ncbi:hypothetical protein H0R92_08500 [Treponema sp. OMZ 840]|uniref:hypothetical protein n=1 Tax=Treponema sp. OMZ 840 TaxID=244313 RepID=UPI003D8CE7DF
MTKKIPLIVCSLILTLTTLLFSACKTVPTTVPEGISEAELLQLGQSSLDNSNYKAAEFYYKKVIELYGSDIGTVIEAEYELAHINIKRKNYKDAKPALERLLAYYDDPQTAALLPPSYKKLALIDLAKCEPKTEKSKAKKKK